MNDINPHRDSNDFDIAIIGMAGRFPDARNVDEFWQNLKNGTESIRPFTIEELKASGVDEKTLENPNFVNAGTTMPDADTFDASFFGISIREAEIMDPQHRVFLETAWEALESAGYCPEGFRGSIGVFGGVGQNTYFQKNLITRSDLLETLGSYPMMLTNEKEYAVTRVSFKLNLKGPSLSVNTACSTSAVAIHFACQSLLAGECDMALAGGAKVGVPLKAGYLYEEGGIRSPDGQCRAFDADARGTAVGNGVGIVVLKRLSDAICDRDCIYAVIKGSAINNDGSQKVGFTAPSIQGQASVIEEALMLADVSPDSIGYVEAHGTGTSLGDPIEIFALTQAFRSGTVRKSYCPIGSVKTNIGHLDAAAGVAGVIKTTLMLRYKEIPPSLNFRRPNPEIDFANSPFYVNTELREWKMEDLPRRAGVSSFGLGGTNTHMVLEEAPEAEVSGSSRSRQLLLISAKSDAALERATKNLADHLRQNPHLDLADVAYTLQTGRRAFDHRRIVICHHDLDSAIHALESLDSKRTITSKQVPCERKVVFMFSGQGSQYVNMGLELYRSESVFREAVDRCAEILKAELSIDIRQVLFPKETNLEEAAQLLEQTSYTQPALFTIEYSLATLWMSWGINPTAMVGHSIGEYVAACLSGVFSLEDALLLVSIRGRLMQEMPPGSMLAVPLGEESLLPHLNGQVSVSVVDSPSLCIVSGESEAIRDLEKRLCAIGIEPQLLHTSHAFHSRMMDGVLEPFAKEVEKINLHPPRIPFVSNVTGRWVTPAEATDPAYWSKQLRQPVRLQECLQMMMQESDAVFLEVGPGRTLSASARRNSDRGSQFPVFSSTRHPKEDESDLAFILMTLGRLWLAGVHVDWSGFYSAERRQRVDLPTYPFERKRYWINPRKTTNSTASHELNLATEPETDLLAVESDSDRRSHVPQAAPRTDIEKLLADMWKGLLGVSDLSIRDNFFDLGGSSLLATRLLTQISSKWGQKLSLADIFEAPTIEMLAGLLERQIPPRASKEWSSLVKLQDGRSRPPFYCVPGNLGNVFTDFEYLYPNLGQDQAFYGLQDGLGNPSKVEALAAQYVEDIRRIQPEGPYLLGGVCSGGVIVFEMAQQLVRMGQRVSYLALIEPATLCMPGVNSYLSLFNDIWMRFTRRGHSGGKVIKLSMSELILFLRLRVKLVANIWSLKQYIPQPFPDRVHIFLTKESFAKGSLWREFAGGGAEVHNIPGTHRSITGDSERIQEDQMRVLAEKIKLGIDIALSEPTMSACHGKDVSR